MLNNWAFEVNVMATTYVCFIPLIDCIREGNDRVKGISVTHVNYYRASHLGLPCASLIPSPHLCNPTGWLAGLGELGFSIGSCHVTRTHDSRAKQWYSVFPAVLISCLNPDDFCIINGNSNFYDWRTWLFIYSGRELISRWTIPVTSNFIKNKRICDVCANILKGKNHDLRKRPKVTCKMTT